jgi:AcrR family transcriptional regulator
VTRARLSLDGILAAAHRILDEDGAEGLTTTRIAQELGVSQPALYSHMSTLTSLKQTIAAQGAQELSDQVQASVDAVPESGDRDTALRAMARAYRSYVRQHSNRYLLQLSALPTDEYLAATRQSAEAVRTVLRAYGLDEDQVRAAHTAFRAAVHGFVHLEAHAALPAGGESADDDFDFFISLFGAGLAAAGRSESLRQDEPG